MNPPYARPADGALGEVEPPDFSLAVATIDFCPPDDPDGPACSEQPSAAMSNEAANTDERERGDMAQSSG